METQSHYRSSLVLIGFLIVAGFFLATEHRAHVFGILPFLLLLACPVMHLFMHGGHGGHGGRGEDGRGTGPHPGHRMPEGRAP